MAFLMLLHEKLRLQRTKNKLYARQIRAGHRKDRVAKQIERINKMYSKRMSSLEATAKQAGSAFKAQLMGGIAGCGLGGSLFGGMGGGLYGLTSIAEQLLPGLTNGKGIDAETLTKLKAGETTGIDSTALAAWQKATSLASQQQTQAYQMQSLYEQNVSIWLEAEKAALEEAQDAEIAPLEEQETDWELEEETTSVQLESIKARLENIEQALRDEVKNSAPSFGLG